MKHPDDTAEAVESIRARAQRLIDQGGMDADEALEQALDYWRGSLKRAQMIVRYHVDLRAAGKPTLHVPLLEAVRRR